MKNLQNFSCGDLLWGNHGQHPGSPTASGFDTLGIVTSRIRLGKTLATSRVLVDHLLQATAEGYIVEVWDISSRHVHLDFSEQFTRMLIRMIEFIFRDIVSIILPKTTYLSWEKLT